MRAIRENGDDTDEFAAAGLTRERCEEINAPAICESFLTMECRLLDARDLSGAGMAAMVTGEVVRVRVEEGFARGTRDRFGEEGFLLLAPGPQNMESGAPSPTSATLRPGCGIDAPRLYDTMTSANSTDTAFCRSARLVSICRPILPALKRMVSKSFAVSCATVRNGFFMPMGEQPPWT